MLMKRPSSQRQALLDRAKLKAQQITDTPFKFSSPTQKHSGVGDFYGSISGKITYVEVCTGAGMLYGYSLVLQYAPP